MECWEGSRQGTAVGKPGRCFASVTAKPPRRLPGAFFKYHPQHSTRFLEPALDESCSGDEYRLRVHELVHA
jgi:hypothetical protein